MAAHHLGVLLQHLRRLAGTQRAEESPDQQLLQRFVTAREEAAFTALVQRHGPMVLGVCQRVLHQWQDAEDAFQATFLVLVRQASSIRKQESVGSWLYRVAYRVARKARASATQRAAAERQVEPRQPSDPDSAFLWRELRPLLDEELDRLPEKYRAPVVLCYLEGKTYVEAARQLGWTKGTLSGRLAQARSLLQRRLTRRGLSLSVGFLGTLQAANASSVAVSPALVEATTRAALLVLAGKAAGVLSAPLMVLTEGVLDAMIYSPWKAAAPLLLAVVVLGTGAGLLTYQAGASRLAEAKPEDRRQTASQGKDLPRSEVEKKERVDRDGEPLPPDALARLGTGRFRHGWRVVKAAFSPDGTVLATSGSGRGWLCFWDTASGKELRRWPAHGYPDSVLAFSPDFKLLAANNTWEPGSAKLCLFDIATGKEVHRLLGQPNQVTSCVAFSPDGKILASGGEGETMHTIHLWEVATGRELRSFQGHQERIK